jgi:hypothetical protein
MDSLFFSVASINHAGAAHSQRQGTRLLHEPALGRTVPIVSIGSDSLREVVATWVHAMHDALGLAWHLVDEDALDQCRSLILTDPRNFAHVREIYGRQHPIACWGQSEFVPLSTPQLPLPATVEDFSKFVSDCSELFLL